MLVTALLQHWKKERFASVGVGSDSVLKIGMYRNVFMYRKYMLQLLLFSCLKDISEKCIVNYVNNPFYFKIYLLNNKSLPCHLFKFKIDNFVNLLLYNATIIIREK